MKTWFITIMMITMGISLFGCGNEKESVKTSSAKEKKEIIIFAAASLTPLLEEMANKYHEEFPDTTITLNTANTQVLKTQIEQGAKVDIFLAARERDVTSLQEQGLVLEYSKFAGNYLEIVASEEGSQLIKQVDDLAKPNIRLVFADETAPIGEYTLKLLDILSKSGLYGENLTEAIINNVVSYESNEQQVLGKILNGEADAGIVFRSSFKTAKQQAESVTSVPFENKYNFETYYYRAMMTDQNEAVAEFTDWLVSNSAKEIITKYGLETLTP